MFWKRLSYQRKLLLVLIVVSSLPVLLVGTIAYQKSSETLMKRTEQDLQVIAGQLISAIQKQVSDFDRFSILPYYMPEAFTIFNRPYVPEEDWGSAELNAQRQLIRLMSAYPSINKSIKAMVLYGNNGRISGYQLNGNSSINRAYDVKQEDWYQEALGKKGGFVVSGVHEVGQFEGGSFEAVTVSRMLLDEEMRPLAVIAIHISPDFIENIIDSSGLQDTVVTVVDANHRLIYASDKQIAARLLERPFDVGTNGAWSAESKLDNLKVKYSGVVRKNSYLGWTIYVGKNQQVILQGSNTIRKYTVAIAAVLTVASALVSWLLAGNLSRPINRLIRSMRSVETGKFEVLEAPTRYDEIGQLHLSYARMVRRLDELVQSIAEKERQKRKAELYALRVRIQPHFLYNTLNSIRMLAILQQSPQIAKLIHALNRLLQSYLKLNDELMPLSREIDLLRDYEQLMDLRYTNTFTVEWDVPEELLDAGVPAMLLQPILENAIFHGSRGLGRMLVIGVKVSLMERDRGKLCIEIKDNGVGIAEEQIERLLVGGDGDGDGVSHIGINNVNDRIRLWFGRGYGLTVQRLEPGTAVIITIPYKPLKLNNLLKRGI
ncbi:sensor histidine kinase [Paenibacillus macerans]|uniref:cache domain-containing sensor histidine kinase n=1 Tax=Paenibacillus macerans TaxID=44252 RepID=UPI00203BB85F|nr:sensor histidine kinase [Paenibacillus macerans]MCM3701802.1 sensor histidine kinase [Paenibacillus macerans]